MDHLEPTTHIGTDRTEQRFDLKLRRVGALTSLLSERKDLRGVNAAADLFDDAVRWTA